MSLEDKIYGCLVGGAIGDALGYPIECLEADEIKAKYGVVNDFVTQEKEISDDTQMTLFSLEGLILASDTDKSMDNVINTIYESYRRWFDTQWGPGAVEPELVSKGILHADERLFAMRAPGHACIDSLRKEIMGTCSNPINLSKGNGCVMRAAPFGFLLNATPEYVYELGLNSAAITHGDLESQECTGAFALLIYYLLKGLSPLAAVNMVYEWLKNNNQPLAAAVINKILAINSCSKNDLKEQIRSVGDGWIAAEAFAIAVLYLLNDCDGDVRKCFTEIINRDGDSDTIAAIFGNLYGAAHGIDAFATMQYEDIECIDLIKKLMQSFLKKLAKI